MRQPRFRKVDHRWESRPFSGTVYQIVSSAVTGAIRAESYPYYALYHNGEWCCDRRTLKECQQYADWHLNVASRGFPGTTPRFTHDCDACRFLGQFGRYDLWVCPQRSGVRTSGSLIARYGSDGPDYESIPAWLSNLPEILAGVHQEHMRQCYYYAVRFGFIKKVTRRVKRSKI
jgi:hypothetical protein